LKVSGEESPGHSIKLIPKAKLATHIKQNKPLLNKEDLTFSFEGQNYRLMKKSNQALSAQNLETGKVGIVTGVIIVKLKPMADFSAFTRNLNFELSHTAPRIRTLFVKFKNLNNPLLDLATLRKNSNVELAEIEVIESKVKTK
jgi:hypothetical protein